jgi:hypothetical protein
MKKRARFSLDSPPTSYTMTVAELAELVGMGRSQAYAAVASGIYPCIHTGKKGSTFRILTAPTLAILRGERPPGPLRRPRAGTTRRR